MRAPQLGGFFLALFNADVFKVKVHTLHLVSVCYFSFGTLVQLPCPFSYL